MQTRLADLGLTLQADGTVEETTADGKRQTVPNLFVSPEGVISLSLADGTVVSVDPDDMSVDEKGGLTVKGYELDENGEWVEGMPKLENSVGEPVLGANDRYYQSDSNGIEYVLSGDEWIRTFPICGLQEGQKCNFEQLADLSEFADFVQTQLHEGMFDPSKINWVSEFEELHFGSQTVFVPDPDTAPHYTQPGSAPFVREEFTGRVMISPTEQGFVVAAPQFIPGLPPEQWPVMIGVASHEGFSGTPQAVIDGFRDDMNLVAWRTDAESIAFATQFVNPATGNNFTEPEVRAIVEEMKQGDFSNTHGLVLKMRIAKIVSGKDIYR
jgi:hypothetical protein